MRSFFLILFQIILFSTFLANCGILSKTEDPLNQNQELGEKHGDFTRKTIEQSRENGKSVMDLFRDNSSEFKENIIWNVALEKISFMPIQSLDKQSGIITTEWFQVGNDLSNRIKLVIHVKSEIIDDSSMEVRVFKENFDGEKWNTADQNSELAQKIKKSILDSSQELYIANEML